MNKKGRKIYYGRVQAVLVPLLLIICRMTLNPYTCHVKKAREHLNILEKK